MSSVRQVRNSFYRHVMTSHCLAGLDRRSVSGGLSAKATSDLESWILGGFRLQGASFIGPCMEHVLDFKLQAVCMKRLTGLPIIPIITRS